MKNYDKAVQEFLKQLENRKIIAFSGSAPNGSKRRAQKVVRESFEVLDGLPIAILTGGTDFDVQRYAVQGAKRHNMPTIGIFPKRGAKYEIEGLDFALEVEPKYGTSEWGDESEIYSKLPQGVEVIGGGMGSVIEFAHIMKMNDGRLRHGKEPVYVAPIFGLGGEYALFSDCLFKGCHASRDVKARCLPDYRILNGREAARFLVDKLRLRE